MFTGIIEEVGIVKTFNRESGRARLVIQCEKVLDDTKYGDSISIEGVCQTVEKLNNDSFEVFTLAESLRKTTLGELKPGSKVNLERAMRFDSRMGGHMVQGHVSSAVSIRELSRTSGNVYLSVEVSGEYLRLCVPEGSVALDGISLTIAKISGTLITVNIIPATFEGTSLKYKKVGDKMNLETDIIGRYVERYLTPFISFEKLRELGY